MVRRSTDEPLRGPALGGVVIERRGQGESPLQRGDLILDVRLARPVINLFLETARALRIKIPAKLKLGGGEIFYDRLGAMEVRLIGHIHFDTVHKQYTLWGAGKEVGFESTPDFRVTPGAEDQGRPHFIAIRSGPFFILSWDLGSNGPQERLLKIKLPREKVTFTSGDEKKWYVLGIHFAETVAAAAASVKSVLTSLMNGEPVGPYDDLALQYSFRIWERAGNGEGATDAAAGRLRIKRVGLRDLKWAILDACVQLAKRKLELDPGRPGGKAGKKGAGPPQPKKVFRRDDVERAVRVVYLEAMGIWGEMAAPDKVTKKAVAKVLKCSRGTLDKNLKRQRINFRRTVDKVINERNVHQ